tara:strand:+ start:43655 stop:43909 length:255 start_codon:yes stop_codon:yes gene_type:complete
MKNRNPNEQMITGSENPRQRNRDLTNREVTVIPSLQGSNSVCGSVFPKGFTLRFDIWPFQGSETRDAKDDGVIEQLKPQRGEIT